MKFNKLYSLIKEQTGIMVLYVGCSPEKAQHLLENGWQPNPSRSWKMSAHGGQGRYLYLTNYPENAIWFGPIVLQVSVNKEDLIVDPEDGTEHTVDDELEKAHSMPGYVCATKPLPKESFSKITQTR